MDATHATGTRPQGTLQGRCFLRTGTRGQTAHRGAAGAPEVAQRLHRLKNFRMPVCVESLWRRKRRQPRDHPERLLLQLRTLRENGYRGQQRHGKVNVHQDAPRPGTHRPRKVRHWRHRAFRLLLAGGVAVQRAAESHRRSARHRGIHRHGGWQAPLGKPISAAFPLLARTTAQLCLQALRWRAT